MQFIEDMICNLSPQVSQIKKTLATFSNDRLDKLDN